METIEMINANKTNYTIVKTIDYEGAIKTLAQGFNEHHEGLRELCKNTAADIARRKNNNDKDVEKFCLAFFIDKTGTESSKIGFLDFGGMDESQVTRLLKLMDRKAAIDKNTKSSEIYGGLGNGGKIYAAALFDKAFWYTCKNNKIIEAGYETMRTSHGEITNPFPVRSNPTYTTNSSQNLKNLLKKFNMSLRNLPKNIQEHIKINKNFTFFIGENPYGFNEKIKTSRIIEDLLTSDIEIEDVLNDIDMYIFHNSTLIKDKKNNSFVHKVEKMIPHKDFIAEKRYEMPDILIDPKTMDEVNMKESKTFKDGCQEKYLTIRSYYETIYNSRFRSRHCIKARSASGIKVVHGRYRMNDVTNHSSAFPRYLYGEVFHDYFQKFASNTRTELGNDKFVRAVQNWVTEVIDKIAIDKMEKDKSEIEKEAKQDISTINKKLEDIFKKDFLLNPYGFGSGVSTGTGIGYVKPKKYPEDSTAVKIELSITNQYAGIGVSFRPIIKTFNKKGELLRNKPVNWKFSNNGIIKEDERNLNLLYSSKTGSTSISVETMNGKLKSNHVDIEVIAISEIDVDKTKSPFVDNTLKINLKERKFTRIKPNVIDTNNRRINNCYLNYEINNDVIAGGSSTGLISGLKKGNTILTIMSDDCESNSVDLHILENNEPPQSKGGGFPKVLLSGIDFDPLVKDSTKPVNLKETNAPVHQRLRDVEAGIWWINLQSPVAAFLRNIKSKKLKSDGQKSREFKVYLMEKWFDIIGTVNLMNAKNIDDENFTRKDLIDEYNKHNVDFQIKMKKHLDVIMKLDFVKSDEN